MQTRLTVLFLSLVIVLFSAAGARAANLSPQTSSQGGVMIEVTPHIASGSAWTFDFALNTHSGSLSDVVQKEAVLVADGRTYAPVAWEGDAAGGHHRHGTLRFNAISPQPKAVELKLQRPGEASPRVFRWELK